MHRAAVAGVPIRWGLRSVAYSSFSSALASDSGSRIVIAPTSSAFSSREREIASWSSRAAMGAVTIATIARIPLLPRWLELPPMSWLNRNISDR